jgi:CHAT domain-containing protein/tetratricopeptide (TPR) repeat protein
LLSGCAQVENGQLQEQASTAGHSLEGCPRGDDPWREALKAAARDGRLAEHETTVRRLAERHPERWEPAWAAGECLLRGTDPQAASQDYREALSRALRAGDPTGIACAANRLGWLHQLTGELDEAGRLYHQALAASREAAREDLEAFVLNNLAGLSVYQGDLAAAGSALDGAIARMESLGLERQARAASRNRTRILLELGDAAGAMRILEGLYRHALEEKDDEGANEAALLLGNTNRDLGRWPEARGWYGKVSRDDPGFAVRADQNLGRLALLQDSLSEARHLLEQAGREARQQDLAITAMFADVFLAEVDLRAGRPQQAAKLLGDVIRQADSAGARDPSWLARGILGKALLAQDRPGEAVDLLRQAISILEQQASVLDPKAQGLRFLRGRTDPYADLAAALVRKAEHADDVDLQRVFEAIEAAHARALRHVLPGHGGDRAQSSSLDLLRGKLEPGTVLLDYLIGEDRGVVLAVGRGRAVARETPGWRRLREPLRRYRAALRRPLLSAQARLAPSEDLLASIADGQYITASLIEPLLPFLDGAERLVVVPDLEMALLPPAALPLDVEGAGGWPRFLGERYETAFLPMAGIPADPGTNRLPVFLAGDPLADDSGDFPNLPWAGDELGRLAAVWQIPGGEVLNSKDLTTAKLSSRSLEEYRTIHLATHAVASSLDPGRCAVILSRGERLGLDAIRRLSLGPALVILSACRTGEGELVPGEGLIGLGRTFLEAGASAVVVSQWSIEDRAAADLMVAFHKLLKEGADPVRALHVASRAAAEDSPHPAYWAPFTIIQRIEPSD